MRRAEFERWLQDCYKPRTGRAMDPAARSSRISNCQRVAEHEGDLDRHFRADSLESLVARLTYTRDDERHNRPARHSIPIDGNIYDGTATLRSAIKLYVKFCEEWPPGTKQPRPAGEPERPIVPARQTSRSTAIAWPEWPIPSESDVVRLARLCTPFVRFLHPDIVGAVVEDNELHRDAWGDGLRTRNIDPATYLWERSPCAFPGIRRHAGRMEITAFGQGRRAEHRDALQIDDNSFPKHLWAFVFTGKEFRNQGPKRYALAHLADHKRYKNRFAEDFEVVQRQATETPLHGLYTSAANTVYVPNSLIKPTDFAVRLRNLLMRRAVALYSAYCNVLPPWLCVPDNTDADWQLDAFEWSEPVGDLTNLGAFLEFRNRTLADLLTEKDL